MGGLSGNCCSIFLREFGATQNSPVLSSLRVGLNRKRRARQIQAQGNSNGRGLRIVKTRRIYNEVQLKVNDFAKSFSTHQSESSTKIQGEIFLREFFRDIVFEDRRTNYFNVRHGLQISFSLNRSWPPKISPRRDARCLWHADLRRRQRSSRGRLIARESSRGSVRCRWLRRLAARSRLLGCV